MNMLKFIFGAVITSYLIACSGGGYGGSSGGGSGVYNEPPTANAGPDQTVTEGDTVSLDGSGTDSDGTITSYAWTQIIGPTVTLSSPNNASTSFTAPATDSSVELEFRLTVTDNGGATASDTVIITVNSANSTKTVTISGKITYDKVPHNTSNSSLDYSSTNQAPVRGATIQLLHDNSVIDNKQTDENGNYSFTISSSTDISLRVRAELIHKSTQSWSTRVVDNTQGDALYVLDSRTFSSGDYDQVKNLHASSGWEGNGYIATRAAAPFHILDQIYDIIEHLKTIDPNLHLTDLTIKWSPNNIAQPGDKSEGQITTSHYINGQIFLLGAEDSDTDEYDGHVVIRKWAHYFEDNYTHSDNIGNAWSANVTDDPFYRDSFGYNQTSGFTIYTQSSSLSDSGLLSKEQSILYDIHDDSDISESIHLRKPL